MQAERDARERDADATPPRPARRAFVAFALAGGAALATPGCAARWGSGSRELAARAEPSPAVAASLAEDRDAGAWPVDVVDLDWSDDARARPVPARLYLPLGAARVPLVVFSHGLGSSRFAYANLGRYWSAHGIASLHVQHVGSDREIWRAPALELYSAIRAAATEENAVARVKDVSFAIGRALADPGLRQRLDATRVGVAGHSFGANTALLAAGATFRDAGQLFEFRDARVRAAIVLSAPSLPAGQDAREVYAPIDVPTLHLTGTDDVTPIPGISTMAIERRIPFDRISATPRYLGIFEGGRHSSFSDWANDPASRLIKVSTRWITLAFWRQVLQGDERAGEELAQPSRVHMDVPATLASWEVGGATDRVAAATLPARPLP